MKKIALLLLALAVMAVPAWATDYYVKADGSDDNVGTSWGAAFATIEKALSLADANNIYVAKGTYMPKDTYNPGSIDALAPLDIQKTVSLYGGFVGTETTIDVDKRDLKTNVTTITGQSQKPLIAIASITNPSVSPVIDGFTLTGGKGEGNGGGIYINTTGTVTVRNCVIKDNEASSEGGGVYVYNGIVNVTNCVFDNNEAQGNKGGGVYLSKPVHPQR